MSDLVQIVDENDNLIGHKERTEVDYGRDIYRSSCIWLENAAGEVLMVQRSWHKDKDPGMWGTAAAGTIDEGETYESNAPKEVEEEIGLTGIELTPVKKLWEGIPRKHFVQVFHGTTETKISDLKLQVEEVEAAVWISKAELKKDFTANPTKYIPLMPQLAELFLN